MKNINIVRAWKDESYRKSLSPEERAQLPENPAGILEISDADLSLATGSTYSGGECGFSACCPM